MMDSGLNLPDSQFLLAAFSVNFLIILTFPFLVCPRSIMKYSDKGEIRLDQKKGP